jgi:hypothetical protein
VKSSLLAEGAEPVGGSPERFAAHIVAEKERLGKIIRDAHIRLE